jgi:hypothetical protein
VDLPGNFDPFHAVGGGFISGLSLGLGPQSITSLGDAALSFSASSTVNGSLTVDYVYGAPPSGVPEPATAGLMSISLLGVGLAGLRRRRARR